MYLILLVAFASSVSAYVSVVTGASGFLGRHVVYSLLNGANGNGNGDASIICLVRQEKVSSEEKYWNAHVLDMQHKSPKNGNCVMVLPYNMLDGGQSLNDALEAVIEKDMSGPICVYHIASVFGPTPDPIQTAKDNVSAAENVVRTLDTFYQRHPQRKPRLVLTSSMAAVRATDQTPLNGKFYTHKDWNTMSELGENWGSCYQWSKAESERRSRQLIQESNKKYGKNDGIEMVALCPSFVFGPPPPMRNIKGNKSISSSSYSLALINQWIQGKSLVQSRLCVDVRDVARAHVAAGTMSELPKDEDDRRYLLSTEARMSSEMTAHALIRGVERAQQSIGGETGIDLSKIKCDTQFTGGAIRIGQKEAEATKRLRDDLGVVFDFAMDKTMQDMAEALLLGVGF